MAPGSPSAQQGQAAAEFPLGLLEPHTKGCLGHLVLGNSVKESPSPTLCPLTSPCSSSPLPSGKPKSVVFFCAEYVAAILSFSFLPFPLLGWKPELWVDFPTIALPRAPSLSFCFFPLRGCKLCCGTR